MTGEQLLRWPAHTTSISGLAFTPDGKQLVSASYDKTIKIWDASNGELIRTIETGLSGGALSSGVEPAR